MLGYIPGVFLGYRQWKAKNDAGDEVDCFITRFVKNYHWETDDLDEKHIQQREERPRLWIAVDQKRQSESLCKRFCNKKNQKIFVSLFLFGAILGVGYSIETINLPFNKIIVNPALYGFVAIGGAGFMMAAFIIVAFGRKELLNKGELFPDDDGMLNDDIKEKEEINIDVSTNDDNLEQANLMYTS